MCRAVKDLRWIAEATYTGEALDFALTNTIQLMKQENRVVLVLTDGRSDIIRDNIPLTTLCGKNIRVSEAHRQTLGVLACKAEVLTVL